MVEAIRDRREAFELLVVENGSTDGTERLPSDYARYARVAGAELAVGRLRSRRGDGVDEARGAIMVHFDVDYVDLGFLEKGMAIVDSGRAGIVLASKPGTWGHGPQAAWTPSAHCGFHRRHARPAQGAGDQMPTG